MQPAFLKNFVRRGGATVNNRHSVFASMRG
jgi:hypothetical protein